MKRLLVTIILLSNISFPQSITGRIANQQNEGLQGKNVTVFLNSSKEGLSGISGADGTFNIAYIPTDVKSNPSLPKGFSISNNYPSPFNPRTYINVTLPYSASIKIKLYDILGCELGTALDEKLSAGTHPVLIDLEKFGNVSEGVYLARIVFDDKYTDVKKLLYIKNSQHAVDITSTASNNKILLSKTLQDIVDSLFVTGNNIIPKTVVLGTSLTGNADLGTIVVDSAFVVDGRIISTIRYDQLDNGVSGISVVIDGFSTIADDSGRFSLLVPAVSAYRNLDISDASIWLRQKKVHIDGDTSLVEDVLTKSEFPDSVMNFFNLVSGRINPFLYDIETRFINKPTFYIVADTTQFWDKQFYDIWSNFIKGELNDVLKGRKYPEGFLKDVNIQTGTSPPVAGTPGYYVIKTSTQYGNAVLLTNPYGDYVNTPSIDYCETIVGMYPSPMNLDYMKKYLGHELASGLVYMPNRNNTLQSWYNLNNPNYPDPSHPTKTDSLMLRYVFSRDSGVDMIDKDWGR